MRLEVRGRPDQPALPVRLARPVPPVQRAPLAKLVRPGRLAPRVRQEQPALQVQLAPSVRLVPLVTPEQLERLVLLVILVQ